MHPLAELEALVAAGLAEESRVRGLPVVPNAVIGHELGGMLNAPQHDGVAHGDLALDPASSLRYWCHVHRRIAGLREREPDRTLIVSFDQLCQQPDLVMPRILDFAGIDHDRELIGRVISGVRAPSSIGRHLDEDLSTFNPTDINFVEPFMATIEMP